MDMPVREQPESDLRVLFQSLDQLNRDIAAMRASIGARLVTLGRAFSASADAALVAVVRQPTDRQSSGRRTLSAEQRAAISKRMKARWRAHKKQHGKTRLS